MKSKRIISLVLVFVMMLSLFPAKQASAAVSMTAEQSKFADMYLKARESYKKNGNIDDYMFPDGYTIRASTYAFISTSIFLDTSEYSGLPVEAYNELLSQVDSGSFRGLDGTAFSKKYASIDITNTLKKNQLNYLLDTISTAEMSKRYLGGSPGSAILISTDNTTQKDKLSKMIGVIMDSVYMNGHPTGTNNSMHSTVGEKNDEVHAALFKHLKQQDYTVKTVKAITNENGITTFSIATATDEHWAMLDETSRDSCSITMYTALQPLMTYTYRKNETGNWTMVSVPFSLVHGGTLYTNMEYLIRKYASVLRGAYSVNAVSDSSNDVKISENLKNTITYWSKDDPIPLTASGLRDGTYMQYSALMPEVPLDKQIINLCSDILTAFYKGEVWVPLNDMIIILAAVSGTGYVLQSPLAPMWRTTYYDPLHAHAQPLAASSKYEQLLSQIYPTASTASLYEDDILAIYAYQAVRSFATGIKGMRPFTSFTSIGDAISTVCPATNMFNLSNAMSMRSIAFGYKDGTVKGDTMNLLSDGRMTVHNMAPVYRAQQKLYEISGAGLNGFKSDKIGGEYWALPAKISDEFRVVTYEGMTPYPTTITANPAHYVISSYNCIPMQRSTVSTEKEESNVTVTIKTPSKVTNLMTIVCEDEFTYETLSALMDEEGTINTDHFFKVEKSEDSKSITLTLSNSFKGISELKFVTDISTLTQDLIFTVSHTGEDLIVGGSKDNKISNIIINTIPDKAYKDDDNPRVERVTESKKPIASKVTIEGTAESPTKFVFDLNADEAYDDDAEVKEGGSFALYEGCSYPYILQFEELPFTGNVTITVTNNSGDEKSKSFTDVNLEDVNEWLTEFPDIIEYHDVTYDSDSFTAKQDPHEWEVLIKKGTSETTMPAKFDVTVYAWMTELTMEFEKPTSTTISPGTSTKVEVVSVGKISRNDEDDKSVAYLNGQYKVTHKYTAEIVDGDELLLDDGELSSTSSSLEVDMDSLELHSKKATSDYTKTNAETSYCGKLTLEEGKTWEVRDTVTIEIYSVKSDEFVKVLEFDEYLELMASDEVPVMANWEKEFANKEETVKAFLNNIDLDTYNLENLDGLKVSYNNDAFVLNSVDAKVEDIAGKSIAQVIITGKFTENGVYQASAFSMSCDGKESFVITQDNTNKSFPYCTLTVPKPAVALAPLSFAIDDGDSYSIDHDKGDFKDYNHNIIISAGSDYSKWSKSVGPDEQVTINFKVNHSGVNGNAYLYSSNAQFGVKPLEGQQDVKEFTITGTKKEVDAMLANGTAEGCVIVSFRYHLHAEYPGGTGSATCSIAGNYSYTQDGATFEQPIAASQEKDDEFKWDIIPPPPIVKFTKEVGGTPQAVLCSTLPSPSKWRWDVMSGIPCTEVMSATVGADVFRIKTSEVAVTYGEPKDNGAFGEDADGMNMTPNPNPAAYREIIFKVNVKDYWGTKDANNPWCELSCPGHSVINGGTTKTYKEVTAEVSASTSDGTTVTESATCPGVKWECGFCEFKIDHASHEVTVSATGSDAVTCSLCSSGCPGHGEGESCTCTCACVEAQGAEASSNCPAMTHSCKWNYTWDCGTHTGALSGGYNAKVTVETYAENANNQLYNLTSVTVEQEEESVNGEHIDDGVKCEGYTTNWGCKCDTCKDGSNHDPTEWAGQREPSGELKHYWDEDPTECTHNMVHRAQTGYRTFTIRETVDAVTYAKIDEVLIQVLQGAEISEADVIWEEGTEGRTCIIDGASFDLWRGNDDDIVSGSSTSPYLNTTYTDQKYLINTRRMYFSGFPSGSTINQDPSSGNSYDVDGDGVVEEEENANVGVLEGGLVHAITKNYEQATSIYLELDIVANSKAASESLEVGEMFQGVFDVQNGVHENHWQKPPNSTAEDFMSLQGDIMTEDEIDKLCTLAVNNWLGSVYNFESTCNTVSDALTLNYKGESINVVGRLWASSPLKIFNCNFTAPDQTIHRSHTSGTNDKQALANQLALSDVSDVQGGSAFYTGFTGTYAPDNEAAMYTVGPGAVLKTRQSLVKSLGTSDIDEFKGHNTLFNIGVTGNSYGDKYLVESDLNLQGLTSGSATTTGSSSLKTSDEFYGSAVVSVEGNGQTQAEVKGEAVGDVLKGESLLPLDVGDIQLTDAQLLTFLGLKLKPSTVNGVYEDSLTINALYKTMISRDGKLVDEFDNEAPEKIQARFCRDNGNQNTINDLTVINPVANRTTLMGNEEFYSVYETDESQEDFRVGSHDGQYIVIGNPFYVWVSNLTSEASTNQEFSTGASFGMWGDAEGESCNQYTGEAITDETGAKGAGKHLNTTYWCDGNTIIFDFPVYYIHGITGERVYVEAGKPIKLWEANRNADGTLEGINQYVKKASHIVDGAEVEISGAPPADLPELPENQLYGDCYQFYCCLSAKESDSATWTCYSYGINYDPMMPGSSTNQNMYDKTNLKSNSIAESTGTVAIVGRIGDISITDTQDFRFGNVFWEESDEWLIKDIVKKPTSQSKTSLMTKFNMFCKSDANWYGTIQRDNTGVGMTSENSSNFPLSSSTQVLEEFKGTNLGIGYTAYLAMSTVGSYTGKLDDTDRYPESVEDEMDSSMIDTRLNKLIVEPFYALYDLDTEKFYNIELYAGSGSDYVLFWEKDEYPKNYTNGISLSMDEAAERLRYCVSDFSMNFSLLYNNNTYSAFTDNTYQGTAGMLVLDERSNMVIGTKYEDAVPTTFTKSGHKYGFNSAVAGGYTIEGAYSETKGLQSPADYAVNARRWFTSIGLPSSTLVTYTDTAKTAVAVKASHEKLLKEHPNSVIVCFANIVALGDVFTLQYDFSRTQGSTIIDICGKSVNYADAPVYINDTVSYKLMSHWAPLFVTDVERTSTQDLLQQGTH